MLQQLYRISNMTTSGTIMTNYQTFQKLEKVVHGTKICEGNIWQHLIFETIKNSGAFTAVMEEFPVDLSPTHAEGRKRHKVDVWCRDDIAKQIFAFNSKGKSFNNTESSEGLFDEYSRYKLAIERAYPGYDVTYAILKDEYDPTDPKMGKYHFLTRHGIPVYNTAGYLQERFGISSSAIETARQERVIEILRKRMIESGITAEQLLGIIMAPANSSGSIVPADTSNSHGSIVSCENT